MVSTGHGTLRCSQRNIDECDLSFVRKYGRKFHRTGAVFYFLGRRDIPQNLRCDPTYARLEGVTLLYSQGETLITAYRNRIACRQIRKKNKRASRLPAFYS
jgi:hypothetical protein